MIDWLPGYQRLPDNNYSSRRGNDILGIVIHGTAGGDGRKTARWAADAELSRSWHFIGYRDGDGCQQVPLDKAAWHAGRSKWHIQAGNPNRYTVGIELANHLLLEKYNGKFYYECGGKMWPYRGLAPVKAVLEYSDGYQVKGWWEPYPEAQIKWLEQLTDNLEKAGIPTRMIGHEEIRPRHEKIDPGPLFPWGRFGRIPTSRAIILGG